MYALSNAKISIITVNYNASTALAQCIASVLEHISAPCEVIIVDNCSTDDSLAFLQQAISVSENVRLIRSPRNFGFAIANNIGAAHATGEYLHFLNPDTTVTPSLDQTYHTLLTQRSSAIWVTTIADINGHQVKSGHLLPLLENYWRALWCPEQVRRWYLGASVIMSRAVLEQVGGWPTDYFMYAEDLDLFYRAAMLGIPVVESNAIVLHASEGVTSEIWNERSRWLRKETAYWKFSQKYGRVLDYFVTHALSILRESLRDPRAAAMQAYALINRILFAQPL